jgi:nucleoside-diphosphate-sugar epimerase
MKRRDFLLGSGLLAAGGAHALVPGQQSEAADSQFSSGAVQKDEATRTVLVTSASTELAQTIAGDLRHDYHVRLTAQTNVQTAHEFLESPLNADELTAVAVRGADAVVYVAEPLPDVDDAEKIDHRTRCTYNLLRAAVDERVRGIVYLSSLRMMRGYEESFQIDEDWRPLATPASGGLSNYLGEFVCREFAREGRLDVIVLRLGEVVSAHGLAEEASNSAWVDPRDVAQAVSRALTNLLANETGTCMSPRLIK